MLVASFVGSNRDFRAWLREQGDRMTRGLVSELRTAVESGKVVALAEQRIKRKNRSRRAARKFA